ncbi:MAG: YXWGXW repeat-containing protein [Caldimonas sp.]
MMFAKLSAVALLAAASAGFSPVVVARPINLDIQIGPPAPRVEVIPAPRRGYIWTPGYWDWRGGRHYWVGGNWARERRGYVYAQPNWVNEGGHWRLNRGGWNRGDRDHDGVPNGRDRHPGNPHRR